MIRLRKNETYFAPAEFVKWKSRCQNSEIITSTPYKESLVENKKEKTEKKTKNNKNIEKSKTANKNKKNEPTKAIKIPKPPASSTQEDDVKLLI